MRCHNQFSVIGISPGKVLRNRRPILSEPQGVMSTNQSVGVRLKVSATAIWSAAASEARRRFGLCLCRIHLKTSLSSQSGVALRLPPHSIKSRRVIDSLVTPLNEWYGWLFSIVPRVPFCAPTSARALVGSHADLVLHCCVLSKRK